MPETVHHAQNVDSPQTQCGLSRLRDEETGVLQRLRWTASWPFVTCRTCRDKGGRR